MTEPLIERDNDGTPLRGRKRRPVAKRPEPKPVVRGLDGMPLRGGTVPEPGPAPTTKPQKVRGRGSRKAVAGSVEPEVPEPARMEESGE
jgi:hypothetical protein